MTAKQDSSLSAQVKRMMLRQALPHVASAMQTLVDLSRTAERESTRVAAAREIVRTAQAVSENMTESEAGDALLDLIAEQERIARVPVPEAFTRDE